MHLGIAYMKNLLYLCSVKQNKKVKQSKERRKYGKEKFSI